MKQVGTLHTAFMHSFQKFYLQVGSVQHAFTNFCIILDDTSGFMFTYKNGSSVGDCNTTETIVLFQCDQNTQWNINYNIITPFLDFFIDDFENECLVNLIISHNYNFFTKS